MRTIEEIEAEYDLNDSIYAVQPIDLPQYRPGVSVSLQSFCLGYFAATVITLLGVWLVLN